MELAYARRRCRQQQQEQQSKRPRHGIERKNRIPPHDSAHHGNNHGQGIQHPLKQRDGEAKPPPRPLDSFFFPCFKGIEAPPMPYPSRASIISAITFNPRCQKAGSEASSPNGASRALCCKVPPARNMAMYRS